MNFKLATRIVIICLLVQERQVKIKDIPVNTSSTASSTTTITTATTPTTTAAAATTNSTIEPRNTTNTQRNNDEVEPEVSLELLNRLVDMGFSRAMSIQALRISPTVEQATEYLLNAPAIHVS